MLRRDPPPNLTAVREYPARVSFAVAAEAYDRFMGRFSVPLAMDFAEWAKVGSGQRALDVGCGPGALTTELVRRLGAAHVCGVDPSESFVQAARDRCIGVDIRCASAEQLPFDDDVFDVTVAQLVVHFMTDPVAGLREMCRVTSSGGRVAACVWDHAGGSGPLAPFWDVVRQLDPSASDESDLAGAREGHLVELFESAGLREIEGSALTVAVDFWGFDDWWVPFTLGVGPAGAYVSGLAREARDQLRDRAAERLPDSGFTLHARAWAARGHV